MTLTVLLAMLFVAVHAGDPEVRGDAAYRRLIEQAAGKPLVNDPAEMDRLAAEFPTGTFMRVSRSFVIVYAAPHAFADSRVTLLESTHDRFFSEMRKAGFRPMPLERRLSCVLFERYESYLDYARRTDATDMSSTGGYYSSATNRVAFFNNNSNPQLRELAQRIAELEQAKDHLDRLIDAPANAGQSSSRARLLTQRAQLTFDLTHLKNHRQASVGLTNIAQTLHEATHQLAFNTGIQKRGVSYPFWVSEGLACNFETTMPAVPFGPTSDNPHRRKTLLALASQNALTPLREFVSLGPIRNHADAPEHRIDLYAQAWGLFHFMFNEHADQLRDFMNRYAEGPPRPDTPAQRIADFQKTFGDIDAIETRWKNYVNSLR